MDDNFLSISGSLPNLYVEDERAAFVPFIFLYSRLYFFLSPLICVGSGFACYVPLAILYGGHHDKFLAEKYDPTGGDFSAKPFGPKFIQ